MLIVFIKTLLLYILIIFSLRIMGKRQIGELQPSELVVTILVSNIATLPIEDTNIPLLAGIVPIVTLMSAEVLISFLSTKNNFARKMISGNPVMVVRDGKIDQKKMSDLRMTVDDLMEQLRIKNIFSIEDVAFAIVETNGSLSVYQTFEARNVTAKMLNLPSQGETNAPPAVVVSNGTLIPSALSYCNLKQEWLNKVLQENDCPMEEIYLLTCDRSANYQLIRKEKRSPVLQKRSISQ